MCQKRGTLGQKMMHLTISIALKGRGSKDGSIRELKKKCQQKRLKPFDIQINLRVLLA